MVDREITPKAAAVVAEERPWSRYETADFIGCHPDRVSELIRLREIEAYRHSDHPASHLHIIPASARAYVARRLAKRA
jgi:hypothetical protein